jgi:hypothetical protein
MSASYPPAGFKKLAKKPAGGKFVFNAIKNIRIQTERKK